MPLFHDAGRKKRPSVHALIIGVGGYPRFAGGRSRVRLDTRFGRLNQLTSPPRSAQAFARWLLANPSGWQAPLGTIDLLISPAPSDTFSAPRSVRPATIENILTAFGAWHDRCNQHADNAAVFYFCGHGAEKDEQYLLAEDFGADANNPWDGALAFDTTRQVFHGCRARSQYFFVDACRSITAGMLRYQPRARVWGTLDWEASECEYDLTMKAAARNELALGPKDGVAYFTQALIQSLEGAVAVKQGRNWVVETGQLAGRINYVLKLVKASEGYRQRCKSVVSVSAPIRTVSTPMVRLVLNCNPELANKLAQLRCEGPLPPDQPVVRTVNSPWSGDIAAGMYRVKADFLKGKYRHQEEYFTAYPPSHPARLECK